MNIHSIDHIVLVVADPQKTCAFYEKVLGMEAMENPPGKWSLKFGRQKISLQTEGRIPEIARRTARGSANFCLLTDTPIDAVIRHLDNCKVPIAEGPGIRQGATGPLMSVYFYDLDGNLVEISNPIKQDGE